MRIDLCTNIHMCSWCLFLLLLLIHTLINTPAIFTLGRVEDALSTPIAQSPTNSASSISSNLALSTTSTIRRPRSGLSYIACFNSSSSEANIHTTLASINYTTNGIAIDTYSISNYFKQG